MNSLYSVRNELIQESQKYGKNSYLRWILFILDCLFRMGNGKKDFNGCNWGKY